MPMPRVSSRAAALAEVFPFERPVPARRRCLRLLRQACGAERRDDDRADRDRCAQG